MDSVITQQRRLQPNGLGKGAFQKEIITGFSFLITKNTRERVQNLPFNSFVHVGKLSLHALQTKVLILSGT